MHEGQRENEIQRKKGYDHWMSEFYPCGRGRNNLVEKNG